MKPIKVIDKMFRTCLEVLITSDDKEVDKYLDAYGYTDERTHQNSLADTYRLRYSNSSSNHTMIRLREKSIPLLAHELIHHAMITMSDKGITVSSEEDEMVCYHVEMHMTEILKKWESKKAVKSKGEPILIDKDAIAMINQMTKTTYSRKVANLKKKTTL